MTKGIGVSIKHAAKTGENIPFESFRRLKFFSICEITVPPWVS